jgi:hypothetical protein
MLTSLPEPYRHHLSPLHVTRATLASQYSYPISPMRPSTPLEPSPSDSRSLRLATSLAHVALRLPEPHGHHPCSLQVTLASLASNNSHPSPLRAHVTPIVPFTVSHDPLD